MEAEGRALSAICNRFSLILPCGGCAAAAESLIDGIFDSIFDTEDDVEIDPKILERKGIEPGSKRHKRWVAEETFHRDFQQKARESETKKVIPEFAIPDDVRL